MREPRVRKVHLSGPTLATNDVVAVRRRGARTLRPGDPIAIFDTGAYSISRANQFTRPRSGVYFITADGQVEIIRHRETVDDVMRTQVWDHGHARDPTTPVAAWQPPRRSAPTRAVTIPRRPAGIPRPLRRVVLGLHLNGLEALHHLVRHGIPVVGLDDRPGQLGFPSRYGRKRVCPNPERERRTPS